MQAAWSILTVAIVLFLLATKYLSSSRKESLPKVLVGHEEPG